MTMQPEQGIGRELGLGEVISKTFDVYRRDFSKYFVLFAIVGVIVQVVTTLAQQSFRPPDSSCQSHASAILQLVLCIVCSTIPAHRRDLCCEYCILYHCRGQRSQTGLRTDYEGTS